MERDELQRVAARLKTALRLCDAGIAMKRAQLRRAEPTPSDAELEQRLRAWLHTRPGALYGDADGVPRSIERLKR